MIFPCWILCYIRSKHVGYRHHNEHIQIRKQNHLTSAQLCPRPVNIGTFLVSVMCGARPYGAKANMFDYVPHTIGVWCINERAVVALKHTITTKSLCHQVGHVTIMLPSMIHGSAVIMEFREDYNYWMLVWSRKCTVATLQEMAK